MVNNFASLDPKISASSPAFRPKSHDWSVPIFSVLRS